jgi:glycosyltransferase involved in cell wall biosynthesis
MTKKRLKICFLADGPNVHTVKWVRHFVNRGHQVSLISFKPVKIECVDFYLIKQNIPIIIDHNAPVMAKLGYLFYPKKIKNLVHTIQPDILHAHWATSYGFMAAYSNYHPLIVSAWGRDVYKAQTHSFIYQRLLKYVFSRADYITATSEHLSKTAQQFVPDPLRQVLHIPFGVDVRRFSLKQSTPSSQIKIGYIKKLEPYYGCEHLIHGFSKILNQYPNTKLIIVGDGSEKERLTRLTHQLDLDNAVEFRGEIPHDEIVKSYHEMDIVVIPSIIESFGVVALEASACGIPVIASDIQGLRETVNDSETGFLIPPEDPDSIAEKLEILIKSHKLRVEMGKMGRKFVEDRYSWDVIAGQMESLYLKCL